jgi:hypothetical protein
MDASASSPKSSRESRTTGTLIVKIRNGEISIYPIGNSDREVTDVLEAVRMAIVCGDFAAELGL